MSVEQSPDQNKNGFGNPAGPDFEPARPVPVAQQPELAAAQSRETINPGDRRNAILALGAVSLVLVGTLLGATDKDTSADTFTAGEGKAAIVAGSGIALGTGVGANILTNIREKRRRALRQAYAPASAAAAPPNPYAPILTNSKRI